MFTVRTVPENRVEDRPLYSDKRNYTHLSNRHDFLNINQMTCDYVVHNSIDLDEYFLHNRYIDSIPFTTR